MVLALERSPSRTALVACINDHHELGDFLGTLLGDEGYQTVQVASAPDSYLRHAAEVLGPLSPDVAIVTLGLPYGQRWQEFAVLQQALPDCRFIVVTTDMQMIETGRFAGGDNAAVLGMPFDVDDLLSAVRYALPAGGWVVAR